MATAKTEATPKKATRVVSVNDISFNKENALMAALSCIPIVGAVVFFVEKKDLFVRYFAAQYGLLGLVWLAITVVLPLLSVIPVIGWIIGILLVCITPVLGLGTLVLVILGAMKAYKGERYDVPLLSKYALQLMSKF